MIPPLMAAADNDFFIRPGPIISAYLLYDEFNTAASAPLPTPRNCEPGPGTLTLVQNDGSFSVSSGKLNFPAQTTPTWGDQAITSAGLSRVAGRALFGDLTVDSTTKQVMLGWHPSATGSESTYEAGVRFSSANILNAGLATIGTLSANTEYQVLSVLRDTGYFQLIRGGAFTDWTLLWVGASNSTATLYPRFLNYDATGTLDDLRVVDLATYNAAFGTAYGLATDREAGAVSAGTTFTHTANCLLDFTVTTLPSAGTITLRFRELDASNYWQLDIPSAGNLTLYERVAGVATLRGNAAAVITNGTRVVVIPDGTSIRGYSNNGLRWTYASASSFQTQTAGRVAQLGTGGAVSDIVTWPRSITVPGV